MNFIRRLCYSTSTSVTWADTKPFVAPIKKGVVIKVYDGDTITIASKLPYRNSPMYRFSVRLTGIDTAEMKTKNKVELEMAKLARDKLSARILNKRVTLKDVKREKYGRLLANVYCDKICLNEWMLSEKLAVSYDGGTKANVNWKSFLVYNKNV
jgi:micrococcal nuclease